MAPSGPPCRDQSAAKNSCNDVPDGLGCGPERSPFRHRRIPDIDAIERSDLLIVEALKPPAGD